MAMGHADPLEAHMVRPLGAGPPIAPCPLCRVAPTRTAARAVDVLDERDLVSRSAGCELPEHDVATGVPADEALVGKLEVLGSQRRPFSPLLAGGTGVTAWGAPTRARARAIRWATARLRACRP